MNPTLDTIHAHRSVRRFEPDPIPADHLRAAIAAGQAASTSSAVQAYHAIPITDPDTRRRLADLCGPQEKVARAGAFLVICGDTRRHRLIAARAGKAYDTSLEDFLVAVIDASLFAQNLVLALESMGYGCCYIGGLRNHLPDVDAILGLPVGVYPVYGLCAGTPAETPGPRPRLPIDAVLSENGYPTDDKVLARLGEYDALYHDYLAGRGADPRGWSDAMADKFTTSSRTHLAGYYRDKGASLD